MAQHDYDIANQTFPSFRSDLNSVLEAINTSNSGTSRPSSAVAGTIWLDTTNATNPTLKLYDGADDISLATFDYSANTVNWIDSTVVFDIVNDTTPQLGGNLDVNGNSLVSTSNGNITFTPDGTGKVVISGLSFPTSDGTCGQAIVTDGCGNLSFASVEGRTGTVNWDTTAKTSSFTAVSGNGYFINTTSSAITLTLPSSPSAGDIVSFKDYAFTFATNNLSVDGNGSPIGGVDGTDPVVYSTNGTSKTFVYVDGTKGWLVVNESTDTSQESNAQYVTATGGTITCCGDYKIHTFTSPGTFTVSCAGNACGSNAVDYLVIAGGGGGGGDAGGGGGAGGYRTSFPSPTGTIPVTVQGYPITVGGGGAGVPKCSSCKGATGSNSVFSTITSSGGGGGGSNGNTPGANGGSGGGARKTGSGGSGNTPPVSPPQGNDGGSAPSCGGAGGGGASVAGSNGNPKPGGDGGAGNPNSITGSATTYAGGGGGGGNGALPSPASGGSGGIGGGGDGNDGGSPAGAGNGTANTGGGGGGGSCNPSAGGTGGSGIVIIRYKYQ